MGVAGRQAGKPEAAEAEARKIELSPQADPRTSSYVPLKGQLRPRRDSRRSCANGGDGLQLVHDCSVPIPGFPEQG